MLADESRNQLILWRRVKLHDAKIGNMMESAKGEKSVCYEW